MVLLYPFQLTSSPLTLIPGCKAKTSTPGITSERGERQWLAILRNTALVGLLSVVLAKEKAA